MAVDWYEIAFPGVGSLVEAGARDYNRRTPHESFKFDSMPFERERERASSAVLGSSAATARGMQARLGSQGLGGIPGLQMAAVNQARQTNLNALAGMNREIGEREAQAAQRATMINEARIKAAEEKDEARRQRWQRVLAAMVGLGVTVATGGLGAPAAGALGTAAGAGTSAAMGGGGGGQQPGFNPQGFMGYELPPQPQPVLQQPYVRPSWRNYDMGFGGVG